MTAKVAIPAEQANPGSDSWLRRAVNIPLQLLAPLPPPARWNYRGRFQVYLGISTVFALCFLAVAWISGSTPSWLGLVLMIAVALSTIYTVQVVPGGSNWAPDDFMLFSAIFILGPLGALACSIGHAFGWEVRRRAPMPRLLYTFNSYFINSMLAWLLYTKALEFHIPGGVLTAAPLTGMVYEFLSLSHFVLGVSLGLRRSPGLRWLGELRFTWPFSIGYAWAALGAAQLYHSLGGTGISMVVVPVILFQAFLVFLARRVHEHQLAIEANHKERVRLLQEMVTKQRGFVADASHEMRTPLTTMAGGLEIMHQFPEMDPAQRQGLVDDAWMESRRLTNLVDSLLEMAQIDAAEQVKLATFEWKDLLHKAVETMRKKMAPREFTAHIDEDLGLGLGDVRWLNRLLEIISNNVSEWTPEDCAVSFNTVRDPDGFVRMEIEDTGPGVPENMLERIFERFVQIDPSRHGSDPGLGLSIARAITDAHVGTIKAEMVQPHGLRIVVRIPS